MDAYRINSTYGKRLHMLEKTRILNELAAITQELEKTIPTDTVDPEQILNTVDQEIKVENFEYPELQINQNDGLPETNFVNLPTLSDLCSEQDSTGDIKLSTESIMQQPLKRIKLTVEGQSSSTSKDTNVGNTTAKLQEVPPLVLSVGTRNKGASSTNKLPSPAGCGCKCCATIKGELEKHRKEVEALKICFTNIGAQLVVKLDRLNRAASMITEYSMESVGVMAIFPLCTLQNLETLEENLKDADYASKMISAIRERRGKGVANFNAAFKMIATDEFFFQFNWDGVQNKKALKRSVFFNEILFEAWNMEDFGRHEYINLVKNEIIKAKGRLTMSRRRCVENKKRT